MFEKLLIDTESIKINTKELFTWTSGLLSPIYCDNRNLLSFPEERNKIVKGLIHLIKDLEIDGIAGVSTAGIPWASYLSDRLSLPLIYVRPNPKEHGLKNQIEGNIKQVSKVVVVEDLISTGKSSDLVVNILKELKVDIMCVLSIFDYQISDPKTNRRSLITYSSLVNFLPKEESEYLENWKSNLL